MRKILFIDHAYHTKTGSAQFLIDLLETRYHVEVARDGWWGNFLGPMHINQADFDAVIFWQLPPFALVPYLECKNVLYFPMFDSHDELDVAAIGSLPNLGVVSFCHALNEQLSNLVNDRLYVKYYPQPKVASGEKLDGEGLFFWQRTRDITWDTIRVLVGENKSVGSVHLHRAVDPGAIWQAPTAEEEKKYSITYSDWFETKEDYQAKVAESALYVAPRRKEGIGMSFLEALAMGKGVIAHDGPTMNEYIAHGENGFLFDCDHPQPIDFGDLARVRRNALESAHEGWRAWERDKLRIVDFIESRMPKAVEKSSTRSRSRWLLNARYALLRLRKSPRRIAGAIARRVLPFEMVETLHKRKE